MRRVACRSELRLLFPLLHHFPNWKLPWKCFIACGFGDTGDVNHGGVADMSEVCSYCAVQFNLLFRLNDLCRQTFDYRLSLIHIIVCSDQQHLDTNWLIHHSLFCVVKDMFIGNRWYHNNIYNHFASGFVDMIYVVLCFI